MFALCIANYPEFPWHKVCRQRPKSHWSSWPNICPCFYEQTRFQPLPIDWVSSYEWLTECFVYVHVGCLCGGGLQRSHCDMSSEDLYHLPLNVYVIVLGIGLFIFMLSVIFCCYLFRFEHPYSTYAPTSWRPHFIWCQQSNYRPLELCGHFIVHHFLCFKVAWGSGNISLYGWPEILSNTRYI